VPAPADQPIGIGDGQRTEFALVKRYGVGDETFLRSVRKPVPGSVTVAVDGVPALTVDIDHATGIVAFAAPPPPGAAVTAGFRFDVPVRFDSPLTLSTRGLYGDVPTLSLREVRS
jgi:uncharacterized protein (TIGR02217 family)